MLLKKFRIWDSRFNEMVEWEDVINRHNLFIDALNNKEAFCLQYIGIKDDNGNEIYEGDIVYFDDSEINSRPVKGYFEVCYMNDLTLLPFPGFILCNKNGAVTNILGSIKIVGNIFENKNLLMNV